MSNNSKGWGRAVSIGAGCPRERIALNQGLNPETPEALHLHARGQAAEQRITERGDEHRNQNAGVIASSPGQLGRPDLADGHDARPGGRRRDGDSRLIDGVAGLLQHRPRQRPGPELARHVAHHEPHAVGWQRGVSVPHAEEPDAALERNGKSPPVADQAGGCSEAGGCLG